MKLHPLHFIAILLATGLGVLSVTRPGPPPLELLSATVKTLTAPAEAAPRTQISPDRIKSSAPSTDALPASASSQGETPLPPRQSTGSFADMLEIVGRSVVTIVTREEAQSGWQKAPRPRYRSDDDSDSPRQYRDRGAYQGGEEFSQNNPRSRRFYRDAPEDEGEDGDWNGIGSGIIFSQDGYILTNHHVVKDAGEIAVLLPGQQQKISATVVGADPGSDVAVLKIERTGLVPASLGQSGGLRVGDLVFAIGHPFGLTRTVTSGIVSALGRSDLNLTGYEDFIQTDAAMNPGNSGGPLVNAAGEVIGMSTAIYSRTGSSVGLGFAIPVDQVRFLAGQILEHGHVEHGFLGARLESMDGGEPAEGVRVTQVIDGSPASKAGLRENDIITAVNTRRVATPGALRAAIGMQAPETAVTLTIQRDGRVEQLVATLSSLSAQQSSSTRPRRDETSPRSKQGAGAFWTPEEKVSAFSQSPAI